MRRHSFHCTERRLLLRGHVLVARLSLFDYGRSWTGAFGHDSFRFFSSINDRACVGGQSDPPQRPIGQGGTYVVMHCSKVHLQSLNRIAHLTACQDPLYYCRVVTKHLQFTLISMDRGLIMEVWELGKEHVLHHLHHHDLHALKLA